MPPTLSFLSGRLPARSPREKASVGWNERDDFEASEIDFRHWDEQISVCEQHFEKNVYQNSSATPRDFHYHRFLLYALIAQGEMLALIMHDHDLPEAADYLLLIEQKLRPLKTTLFEWHGSTDLAPSVPDDFAQGMRDVAAGRVVDLDKALEEAAG